MSGRHDEWGTLTAAGQLPIFGAHLLCQST